METIEYIFKTIGFQSATILALISFFITRIWNRKDKKDEQKFSLFQNMKVQAINNFMDCYVAAELSWIQLPFEDVFTQRLDLATLDEKVLPTHNKLMAAHYKLNLFLSVYEMEEISKIYDSINLVKAALNVLLFESPDITVSDKVKEFKVICYNTEKKNRDLLYEIGLKFRKLNK
jgi:hypothetical protein